MAGGETQIYDIGYIDRGYDHIEDKLLALGADIRRTKVEDNEDDHLEYIY